jgi:ABC-2 type transport system ATP-binding protein
VAEPVIQTHDLTKVFKDFWLRPKVKAVDGLSLTVRRGEIYGLLGPNGSGKSTTIKLLLGLLFPTRGQVSVLGRPPTDVSVKERIGFLPEESYLYPWLNADETLDFYGRLFRLAGDERRKRVDALLRMTGLEGARDRLLGEYSKGMARRIGIAQALINDPDVVILDEPTTGLDPIGTREIKDLILQLREKGKTLLLCSHLLADVEDVCDRVAILYGGHLQAEGTTEQLLRRQEVRQITGQLDDETVRQVAELIERRTQHRPEVSAPRERLEELFLRVVEEARREARPTGGVGATETKLEFLTASEEAPEAVLERLTRPAGEAAAETAETTEASAPAEEAPAASRPAAERSVLADLTAKAPPAERVEPPAADQEPAPRPEQAPQRGRQVLDRLVQPRPEDEGGDAAGEQDETDETEKRSS